VLRKKAVQSTNRFSAPQVHFPMNLKRLKAEGNSKNRGVCLGLRVSEFGGAPAFAGTKDVVTLADFLTGADELVG